MDTVIAYAETLIGLDQSNEITQEVLEKAIVKLDDSMKIFLTLLKN